MLQAPRALLKFIRHYADEIKPVNIAYDKFDGNSPPSTAKPPIVIMHGVLGSKRNWRSIGHKIADVTNRDVYTVDARNHGDSPHTDFHTSRHMAADVVELMKNQGLKRICCMGHSMGGRCMMMLSLTRPELIEKSIFVDISPVNHPTDVFTTNAVFDIIMKTIIPRDFNLIQGREYAKKKLLMIINNPRGAELILKNLRKDAVTREFYWAANIAVVRHSWSDFTGFKQTIIGLRPYNGPTLFINGSRSKFFKPDDLPEVKQYFPNAEVVWLNTGHLVHSEDPAGFVRTVKSFLNT